MDKVGPKLNLDRFDYLSGCNTLFKSWLNIAQVFIQKEGPWNENLFEKNLIMIGIALSRPTSSSLKYTSSLVFIIPCDLTNKTHTPI